MTNETTATSARIARLARVFVSAEMRMSRRLDSRHSLNFGEFPKEQRSAKGVAYREAWLLSARVFDSLVGAAGSRDAASRAVRYAR